MAMQNRVVQIAKNLASKALSPDQDNFKVLLT